MSSKKAPGRRTTILSVSILSGAAFLFAAQATVKSILSAPVFQVKEIEVQWPKGTGSSSSRYRLNPPNSVFLLDLNAVASALQHRHPAAEVEMIRRILPNRLVARLRLRRPMAQIKADLYYPVAEEGLLLSGGKPTPWPHLPILFLEGLKGPWKPGQTVRHSAFEPICELLAAARRQGGIAGHGVSALKTKGSDLFLYLDSSVEIRFSRNRLEPGWQHLMELAAQRREIFDSARYVDLRFDNPAIGGNR